MNDATERWLPVVGHEGFYEVSDLGRVWGVERQIEKPNRYGGISVCTIRAKPLAPKPDPKGYVRVALSREGRVRYVRVHTLVLTAFVGPRPPGKEGLHDDGDGANNALSNLRWGTSTENSYDTVRHGRHHYSSRDRCAWDHLFAGANLLLRTDGPGGRRCRSCVYGRHHGFSEPEQRNLADWHYAQIMTAA